MSDRNVVDIMPRARAEGFVERELGDEVIVYDLRNNSAHCLNRCAWLVWRACDGRSDATAIAQRVSREIGAPVDEGAVVGAIEALGEQDLLDEVLVGAGSRNLTRRQMVRAAGVAAAIAIPVITSILAPTAYAAVSNCVPQNGTCGTDSDCCTGLSCQDVGAPTLVCT